MNKNKPKGFLSILLTLCMIVSILFSIVQVPTFAASEQFPDMPDNWSTAALKNAVANGLLQGSDGKILPNEPLSRAQMATIIVRAFGATAKGDAKPFTDVASNAWYADAVAKAYQMGVIFGSGGKFNPNDPITRQEAFAIIARAFKLEAADTLNKEFKDADKIASWFTGEIYALVNAGYVQGNNGILNPTGRITRAEFAQVFDNVLKQYFQTGGEYSTVAEGNIMINTPGVTLKDVNIKGDLIIGDGVGDGDVTLHNVTVSGRMVVRGGGANSIKITGGSVIGKIIVDRGSDGTVRVYAEDGTEVGEVIVDGNDDIIIEGEIESLTVLSSDITIKATDVKIGTTAVEGENVNIILGEKAGIDKIEINGENATINTGAGSNIGDITVNASGAGIEGLGKVKKVDANASNVTVDTPGTSVNAAAGTSGVTAGPKPVNPGSTVVVPSQSEGTSSSSSYTPPTKTAVSAITVTGANTVVKAKTLQMGVDITPTTATNKKVIWSVIDGTGSATISSSGLLTATKVGTVTVKAVAQDGSGKEGIKEIIITAAPVTVTGVTIKTPPTKVTYIEGENLELAGLVVTLAKSDSSTEDVAFSDFGSKGITTVKANGAILGVGDTKVTISVNGQTVYQAITVNPSTVAVTGVILNKSTLNLTVGATETITATVQPTNASNKNVTWTSSDEAIATVDNTGKIEAVAVGTATITVTSVADSSKKATVEVIVLTETSEEYFVFEQATGTITGYKDEGPKNIAIPAKIDGVDVKVIGAEAFAKKELTSVVIPNSVKTIKEYAFLENKLISINIPTSVTSIGALAFTDNQLPDDQAFIYARNSDGTEDKTVVINYGGEKREDVVIPDSVVTIEEGAFASNELTSIAIPNSVTIIGKTAFAHNELLSINIPNSVTDIGEGAYQYNKLTSVMIPESVTTLGDNAFQKNGPDSESGNIPTTEFVGSWKLIGTEWERDYKLAQDTDFSGTTNGEFKYIGTDEYVEIPYEINGVPVTSYKNMFEGTSVVGVKSTKLNITSMEGMFKDSQATVLDLSDFNTSSDPNMDGMFTGSTAEKGYARTTEDADRFNASSGKPDGLTFVAKEGESYVEAVDSDFSGTEDGEFRYIGSNQYVEIPHVIKGVPVTSYYKMFEGTSVKGVKSNNENVTNMSNMFYKSQASSLDLSNFDTSNVTDMSGMFRQSQATSVDLSSFDTSNVVDMFFMFNRSQARSLDLSKFDTSKVESMGRMFQNSQATVLDLSNFNTSNVITMEFMFDGSQANSLNLSSFDTSKVTTMNCMFKESQASSLDLSNFDTSNVTNMRSMFKNSQATVLDLSKFDTSNVTEIEEMFYGSQASTLDLSSFNTSKIITMNRMFKESQASTLDLSSFDTSKVKYMRDMFNGSQAASLDLSSFDTSNVTDMLDMFRESKATILDLSSFDTSKVEYTTEMFLDSKATTGYARTQIDANKFNESSEKPAGLNFVVKDAPTVPVSNIKLTPESLELTVGGELGIIIATVEPSNATNKNVTWASSDDTKATVDANGKVKGVAAGTATITVTTEDGSRTATVSVKVKGERIKINKIVATSTIDTPIHGTDVEIERPTFTVIEGSPAYFYVNSGNGWWEKKNGDNWEQVSSGTFSEGRWRFRCRVRIDGKNNTTHILDEPLVVTVNEEVWEGNYFSIGEKYSQKFVFSSEYEVTAPVYASTNTLANETITVANGSTEADAIGTLDKTVGVVGSKGETGIATIAWTITSYDGSKGGDYEATGVLTLPSGWTGTVENVTAKLTVIPEGTELIFNIGTYELPFNLVNEDITPQSVDSFVEGGTKPYKFSKISGPDWVIVSEEGEISGKPTVIGTNSDLVIRVIDAKNVQTERSIKVGKTVPKPKDRININKVVATSTIEAPIYGATIGNLASIDFEVTEGSPAYFTINRSWEKKDGDSWKKESSGTFSEGTWRFSSQVRIDKDIDGKDGTTHKLTQPFKVVVNDNNWTVEESSVLISNTYSYGIAKSSEYTVMKP